MRNQSPGGALVSPREIPAGSKESSKPCQGARNRTGRRTAVRNQCPSGALVSPREIPAGSKENGNFAEARGIEQGERAYGEAARTVSNVGRFLEFLQKFPLDKAAEYSYNIKREIWQ